MVFSSEVLDTIDGVIELYEEDFDKISSMVDELCNMYPDVDQQDFRKEIEKRFTVSNPNVPPALPRKLIPEVDMNDAFLLGLTSIEIVDYLHALHPDITRDEIEMQFILAMSASPSRSSSRDSASAMKTRITYGDVNDALEFYSFQFNSQLKEKIIKYMSNRYPSLSRRDIIDQLKEYDFNSEVVASPKGETSDGGTSWTPTKTPPRRGLTYQPSDFSPSLLGACSSSTIEFLREKRSEYLPDYASPKRTSRGTRRLHDDDSTPSKRKRYREDSTPRKRHREDSTPSPRKRHRENSLQPTETVYASRKRRFSSTSPDSRDTRESGRRRSS